MNTEVKGAQTSTRKVRQYEAVWLALKEQKSVEILLQPDRLTEKQLLRQTATFRKAVSKEKYMDEEFKLQFPDAEVTSTRVHRTITFKLELNYADPFTDF